jgi:hypothetical protein
MEWDFRSVMAAPFALGVVWGIVSPDSPYVKHVLNVLFVSLALYIIANLLEPLVSLPELVVVAMGLPFLLALPILLGGVCGVQIRRLLRKRREEREELEAFRLEEAKRIHAEWRKTEDAKNWVEMEDGEFVEVENLHWERLQGRKWQSCYESTTSSTFAQEPP